MPVPGTDQLLQSAAAQGWTAVALVVVGLAMMAAFAFIGKWLINNSDKRVTEVQAAFSEYRSESVERESRLAERVSHLETFIEATLTKLISDCSAAIVENSKAMQSLQLNCSSVSQKAFASKPDTNLPR